MNRIQAIDAPTRNADGKLLAQFLAERDDQAFAELLHRHSAMVFGVCFRRLGQCQDAEDAFQAVFLALAEQASQLADRPSVGPWLYTVARRISGKALRSRRRRRWVFWGSTIEPTTKPPVEVDVDLDAALASLSEQERSAIILCHLEGLSRSEAAKALGIPEGTLSARLSRGLEKLRRKLGKEPVGILAGSLMVAPPEQLPASTLQLVRHWRSGTLEDWASARTLDLFREDLPMRWLNRIGPALTAVAAAAFIMFGAGWGWRLIVAQDSPFGNPKDERSRPGKTTEKALTQGGSQQRPVGGNSNFHDPFNVVVEIGEANGDKVGSLAEAVKQFNERARQDPIGKDQPPLTVEEVLTAIRMWASEAGAPSKGPVLTEYQRVADTGVLPAGTVLDSTNKLIGRGFSADVWWIHLRVPQRPGGPLPPLSLRIRDQKIRSRPLSDAKGDDNGRRLVVYRLQNSSADAVAESLARLIGGNPQDARIVADPRTNSILVHAPESKHALIQNAIQALDELQKK